MDQVADSESKVELAPFEANYVAAMVEYAAVLKAASMPDWTRSVPPLETVGRYYPLEKIPRKTFDAFAEMIEDLAAAQGVEPLSSRLPAPPQKPRGARSKPCRPGVLRLRFATPRTNGGNRSGFPGAGSP